MNIKELQLRDKIKICKFNIIKTIGQTVIWSWIRQGTLKRMAWLRNKSQHKLAQNQSFTAAIFFHSPAQSQLELGVTK